MLPQDQEETLSDDIPTIKMSSTILKVIIVGEGGVGKTAIRNAYCDSGFKSEYKEVIGADFATKHFTENDKNFALQVWDIAALNRFEQNREVFFRGTNGVLLVFDITRKETFDNIPKWVSSIRNTESDMVAFVLIGNKMDKRKEVENPVTFNDGHVLASKLSSELGATVHYVETCAITKENVAKAFQILQEKITLKIN